jgi:hypothetical protein|eukprot:1238751-Prymnesium_polylepis.2
MDTHLDGEHCVIESHAIHATKIAQLYRHGIALLEVALVPRQCLFVAVVECEEHPTWPNIGLQQEKKKMKPA